MDLNFVPPPGATSSVALATSCPQPFPGPVLHQGGEANDRQRTGALRAFEMGWDMADQLDMVDMYSRYAYIFVYIYIFAFRIFDNEDTNKNITSCSIAAK